MEYNNSLEVGIDLFAKRLRKIAIEKTLLKKNKLVVPATRVRKESDTLMYLRNLKLCPAVIAKRDEFEDLDFVLS